MDAAQPPASPPPLQLFRDTVPEHGGRSIEAIESSSWWKAPRRNNEIPRWTIGHTAAVHAPGGLALSAGVTIGELFVPLASPKDPSPAFLPSRAFRLGIRTAF